MKVLDSGMRSCNGGEQQWQIGKRVTAKGKIEMCRNGIHLTLRPSVWEGKRVFIAETSKVYDFQRGDMKAVCRSVKLLLELSDSQLKAYEEGEAPLWKAYEEGEAPLLKAHEEGKAQLWKAHEEGEAQLWKAHEEGKAQLWKAHEETCQKILTEILHQGGKLK